MRPVYLYVCVYVYMYVGSICLYLFLPPTASLKALILRSGRCRRPLIHASIHPSTKEHTAPTAVCKYSTAGDGGRRFGECGVLLEELRQLARSTAPASQSVIESVVESVSLRVSQSVRSDGREGRERDDGWDGMGGRETGRRGETMIIQEHEQASVISVNKDVEDTQTNARRGGASKLRVGCTRLSRSGRQAGSTVATTTTTR
eukprot:GHVU01004591.1.p1 GENE.GHVU01004591.1~~GHVU01004591.1.p1  ORF type:complete len:203 (+),score=7.78 GHVU01004591.1:587-1195(+)